MLRLVVPACLCLAACGDPGRIGPADTARPSVVIPAGLSGVGGGGTVPSSRYAPLRDPGAAARAAQIDRLARLETRLAAHPATGPVAQADIDELARQRRQAQAIAAASLPARPVLRPADGRPVFIPPAGSDTMDRAIDRARTAEAAAYAHAHANAR